MKTQAKNNLLKRRYLLLQHGIRMRSIALRARVSISMVSNVLAGKKKSARLLRIIDNVIEEKSK